MEHVRTPHPLAGKVHRRHLNMLRLRPVASGVTSLLKGRVNTRYSPGMRLDDNG
jgi:hypothetical protein